MILHFQSSLKFILPCGKITDAVRGEEYNRSQMATKIRNGSGTLSAAMALLIQNQAAFVAHLDEDRQRFSLIERDLDVIKALLIKHEEILQKLPDAIKEKIGFKQ